MFGPDGAESFSSVNEVVEFSQATLDASLFDVPEGYREVKDFASAFSAPATTGNTETSEPATTPAPASNATTPAPATTATPEKKQENPVKKGLKSLKPKW